MTTVALNLDLPPQEYQRLVDAAPRANARSLKSCRLHYQNGWRAKSGCSRREPPCASSAKVWVRDLSRMMLRVVMTIIYIRATRYDQSFRRYLGLVCFSRCG